MRLALILCVVGLVMPCAAGAVTVQTPCRPTGEDRGFLDKPSLFINNERDFPLTGLDVFMPAPGTTIPGIDVARISGDHWRQDGVAVQPGLDLDYNWIRVGALHGFNNGWAAGVSIPWYRNRVFGEIGGLPASGIASGFGNIAFIGKKTVWTGKEDDRVVVSAGFEAPTGKNDSVFGQSNAVTNAYFSNSPVRMPLDWQPGSGTFNGLLAASYGKFHTRTSYEVLVATKLYSANDEDVKIGNVLIASVNGTYGISKDLAFSLGFTLRDQADDSYPNAPPPGVQQPALAGTTTHSALLYLDVALRYRLFGKLVIGGGFRTPIVDPDSGMVPTPQLSIIAYPSIF